MLFPYCSKPTLTPGKNLVILPKPRFACMCAYMWACEHPTTTTLWTGKNVILHKSLVCFGQLWLQIYQLESSCTVVPSCERNILMQIDTDIILIVLDPKQYMSQNILEYWSVWRWFKPSLKPCNVFGDFEINPMLVCHLSMHIRASSVKLCLYGFSTMCHHWRWWH